MVPCFPTCIARARNLAKPQIDPGAELNLPGDPAGTEMVAPLPRSRLAPRRDLGRNTTVPTGRSGLAVPSTKCETPLALAGRAH